jgi:tRNA-2-methylthio-N6-dimethylallyladenosine synthase
MPFLHLPIQSGSNNILKAMNRKHTRQDYFKIIEKLRKACPNIGLSSDFIVGFPSESDADFNDTIDLVKQIEFTQCYSFKYSPRNGTPSADFTNQIDEKIKDDRLAILQSLLTQQQVNFNLKFENTIQEVLFEKEAPKSRKSANNSTDLSNNNKIQLWGKSKWLQSVVVEVANENISSQTINKIAKVKIQKSRPSSLVGELV